MTTEELAKLTPEEKRIKIAELRGWTLTPLSRGFDVVPKWWNGLKGFEECTVEQLPDSLNDLNAMHEAEKVLSRDQLESYQEILYNVVDGKPADSYVHWSDIGGNHGVFTATAAQRADAFLLCF